MEYQALGDALEREHREIDEGLAIFAAGLADGAPRLDALNDAAAALRRHIYLEEQFLFPALGAAGLIAPVMVMLREHGEIWESLDEVLEQATNGRSTDGSPVAHDRLADLLNAHNEKEEAILYPATNGAVGREEQARLVAFLVSGTLPEGWVCERLRSGPAVPRA